MNNKKFCVESYIEINPKTMAEIFSDMDDNEQALFFSHCEQAFMSFDYEAQVFGISKEADDKARSFIFRLANFMKAARVGDAKVDGLINHYHSS